ncbi:MULTISPECIES: hypothetical protein [unclassified Agarivorans]|uniref:hypothetical protein n=1 Tax=unclassified Agarivorans TaxID=2636026 RepID=UPI003D7E0DE5
MTQTGIAAKERRGSYRVVYPVRLIQLFIKMVNAKAARGNFIDGVVSAEKLAHIGQLMPMVQLAKHVFPVLDVSEGGFRTQWRTTAEPLPISRQVLLGRLIFHQDFSQIVDYLPKELQQQFAEFSLLYGPQGYEHSFQARISRKIENQRDPYPQLCLQFSKTSYLPARFVRQQETMLIKLFREQYIERVRVRRQQLKRTLQK